MFRPRLLFRRIACAWLASFWVRDRWIRGRYHPASDHAVAQHGLGGAGADDDRRDGSKLFWDGMFHAATFVLTLVGVRCCGPMGWLG
jgi:hypothetical protein